MDCFDFRLVNALDTNGTLTQISEVLAVRAIFVHLVFTAYWQFDYHAPLTEE